jgi:succinate dehydrogenase / fumarate reductase flavoprotein subunit
VYKISSNAHALTGDGPAVCYRRGVPMEDMEFFQFHPTGIYKMGILITEAARGEGGILLNGNEERFMERYAPTLKDLAPRDMVSRCIYQEIREGRGVKGQDYVYLDVRHLGAEVIREKLPDITEFIEIYLGIDPVTQLVPIQPTAHYGMGGIPTDIDGRVVIDEQNTPVAGLYAAGECACVSVHGANRLGTNSLVDIIVFGRRAGQHIVQFLRENPGWHDLPAGAEERARAEVDRLLNAKGDESIAEIRRTLQEQMMDLASVVRDEARLLTMRANLAQLRERYCRAGAQDKGKQFNTDMLEAWELGCLLDIAEATVESALARQESRGAHYREDFPKRDDSRFLAHSLAYRGDGSGSVELRYKPVVITKFPPKERVY